MVSGEANAAVFQKTSSCNSNRSCKSLAPSKLVIKYTLSLRPRDDDTRDDSRSKVFLNEPSGSLISFF